MGPTYVLADFEHCGFADDLPSFEPLPHWPRECSIRGAPYTAAADIFCVGSLMESSGIQLDGPAHALQDALTLEDPLNRPTADNALNLP